MDMLKDIPIPEGKCVCSVCGEEKDNSEYSFYGTRFTKTGERLRVNTNCKSCHSKLRKQQRKAEKNAGVPRPIEGALCMCCQRPIHKYECDHDHSTGLFRGWICKDCNVGLGKFGDSLEGLIKPILYLLKTASKEQKETVSEKLAGALINGK